ILFAGGFKKGVDYFPNNIENLVEIYQPATNTWSSVPLSEARGGITSATINNKVYFAGGWNTALSNKIDVYDATTNSWSTSTLSYLPTAKTAIVYGKNIYWTDGSCKVEIRNVETGTSSLESLSRSGNVISVVKDNKLVFVRPGSIYFDIYDPSIKAWSVGVLPQQVPGGAAVISVNNTIYVAGGITGSIPMGATTKQIGTNQVWKLEF
ncbi:MAG: Kelch repeat-containing protein, partial [Flavisolibacter sp.]